MADLITQLKSTLPTVIEGAGKEVSSRVTGFLTAEIRNPNTREAYLRLPSEGWFYQMLNRLMRLPALRKKIGPGRRCQAEPGFGA